MGCHFLLQYWLKVNLKSNHWICKRKEDNTKRNKCISSEDGGRDWSNTATNQVLWRIAQSLQELKRQEVFRENMVLPALWFQTSSLEIYEEIILSYLQPTQSVVICYDSPSRLMQTEAQRESFSSLLCHSGRKWPSRVPNLGPLVPNSWTSGPTLAETSIHKDCRSIWSKQGSRWPHQGGAPNKEPTCWCKRG